MPLAIPNLVKPIGGRLGFFDEEEESEDSISSGISNFFSSLNTNLGDSNLTKAFEKSQDFILEPADKITSETIKLASETKDAMVDLLKDIFPAKGKVEKRKSPDEEKKQQEAAFKRTFYSRLQEDMRSVKAKDREQAMEDTARLMVSSMSNAEQNMKLKLNASYKQEYKGAYHLHLLRKQMVDELKKAKQEKQSQQISAQSRSNLLNMNAQEGQSMVSSSGAIMSAG